MPDGTSSTGNTPANVVFTTTTPTPTPKPADDGAAPTSTDESPKFTQADVDRIVQSRVAKYGDYDDIKTKLTAIEERDKSEIQKAVDARDKAAAEAAAAARELSIYRAAAKHGVPAEYVDLIDGADDAAIDEKAARVAALANANAGTGEATLAAPTSGYRLADPGQSQATQGVADEEAVKEAFARQLFQLPAK